jgi:hypothetical protein
VTYKRKVLFRSPSLFYLLVHSRCTRFLLSLDHTQTHTTVGRTPLDEGSACRRDLYLTTQTLYKRQTSMPPVGFEPTIPASAQRQTYALECAASGISHKESMALIIVPETLSCNFMGQNLLYIIHTHFNVYPIKENPLLC